MSNVGWHLRADKYQLKQVLKNGNLKQHVEYLLNSGTGSDIIHDDYGYALILASRHNELETVRLLLEAGADPSVDHYMAIRMAVYYGYTEIVRLLLKHGASGKLSKKGQLQVLGEYDDMLNRASEYGHLELVQIFLSVGADIHNRFDYPLRFASKEGHVDVVRLLLERGANVHAPDSKHMPQYECPLRMASENGHSEVVRVLLEYGANVHIYNDLPLHRAIENGHSETASVLSEFGAKIDIEPEWSNSFNCRKISN